MMSEEQSRLLADIRELTVEMEAPRLSLKDQEYLKLCADILRQVKADGVPAHPIVEYVKNYKYDCDCGGVIGMHEKGCSLRDTFNVCTICNEDYDTRDSEVDDVCPECWV